MPADHIERLKEFAATLDVPFGPELADRINAFLRLLTRWNDRIRLTGDRDLESLTLKHCADSLAAASRITRAASVLDIGSGGGFPGIVAACTCPEARFTLLDSKAKACSFLEFAASEIGLFNVTVLNQRLADLVAPQTTDSKFDIAVSRGVRLEGILSHVSRVLRPRGVLLAMVAQAQDLPRNRLAAAGFRETSCFNYTLPTGETRRILKFEAS